MSWEDDAPDVAKRPCTRRCARSAGPSIAGAVAIVVALFAATVVTVTVAPIPALAAQNPNLVVINEIFYHPPCLVPYPACPDAQAEFIELHNADVAAVDISGWKFSDGVDYVFPPGTVLAGGAFILIVDDLAGFNSYFPHVPHGQWSGGLSNGGERLALVDELGQQVDSVTYTDGSGSPGAWSVDADGTGNSLSLLSAANADGSSIWWDAAIPTPMTANANQGGSPSALVQNFVWTIQPDENQAIEVTADVYGGSNVSLEYRIGYPGTTQSILMADLGGDRFSAQIPSSAYTAGDLVRFRIQMGGVILAPRENDTIDWVGTTIGDPSVQTTLPVIEWFTDDTNYDLGYDETGDTFYDGVLAYDGVVFDNVGFRIRGGVARSPDWTKRNWKFKLPDHHDFFIDGISYGLDTIDLQGGFADEARVREYVGHTVAGQMGLVASQVQHVRLHLNGEFFGLHTLQEHPEGGFLDDNGLDNATLFKGVQNPAYEAGPTGIAATTTIEFEDWDIPEYINMLAGASVIQNNDFAHDNFYFWFDADEHERYEGMIWDLDMSQGIRWAPDDGLTIGLEDGAAWSYVWNRWRNQAPMFEEALSAPYRELYLRRVRTLADEWFGTGQYEFIVRDAFADISAEWVLDVAEWGFWGGQSFTQQGALDRLADTWIDGHYAHILAGGPDGDIPEPQPADPDLELFVDATPADHRSEHIRIRNNEDVAIDISGWQLGGSATAVLAPGAVLPSNGSAYIVGNDRLDGFRAVTTDLYVLGEYDAALDDAGGTIELRDGPGQVRASTTWGAGAPTPGLILNEWNAVGVANFLLNGDTTLGSIPGNGDDWFELIVVEDHLDIRDWSLEITDDGAVDQVLTFTSDPIWSDLRAGTILTVAEATIVDEGGASWPEDVSYRPEIGDWWIHVVAGTSGSGLYITAADYRVSNDDWQLAVYDDVGVRRFGPAGEGIGSLAAGGISTTEIGELEDHPSSAIDPSANYGDGDESSFGQPNTFADQAQDLNAIRPDVYHPGDVNCGATVDIIDALLIAQYTVAIRTDSGGCPIESSTELNAAAGDIDQSGTTNIIDALLIAQCTVLISHEWCPLS